MNWIKLALVAAIGGFFAGTASAATFSIEGLSNPDENTATVMLSYDGVDTLTVTIDNTSDFGTVTGFALNAPTSITGISSFSASGFSGASTWDAFYDPNDVGTPQNAGFFDVGSISDSTNGSTSGSQILDCAVNGVNCDVTGGNPPNGIKFDDPNGVFVFVLTGTGLDTLTTASFADLFSAPENGGSYQFAVRFQETRVGSGSDVGVPVPPVPLPAAGWLMIAGLGGLAALRKKRKA